MIRALAIFLEAVLRVRNPNSPTSAATLNLSAVITLYKASGKEAWLNVFYPPLQPYEALVVWRAYPNMPTWLIDLNPVYPIGRPRTVVLQIEYPLAIFCSPLANPTA
jgi:hypothetical protein